MAVCRHAFGTFWGDKSGGGMGCRHPVDGVADAWYAGGWAPDAPGRAKTASVRVPVAGGVVVLACPPDAPTGVPGAVPPRMPRRPPAPRAPRRPTRPKVSDAVARQAELFFGRGA